MGLHLPTDSRLAPTALALFWRISRELALTEAEQAALLGVSDRTVRRYRRGDALPDARDTLERISHLTAIWLDLVSLFRTHEDAIRWLRSAHQRFGNDTPLRRLLAGNVSDLVDVRYEIEGILVR